MGCKRVWKNMKGKEIGKRGKSRSLTPLAKTASAFGMTPGYPPPPANCRRVRKLLKTKEGILGFGGKPCRFWQFAAGSLVGLGRGPGSCGMAEVKGQGDFNAEVTERTEESRRGSATEMGAGQHGRE